MTQVLEVIPLGGLGEFGMNMMVVRYGDDMFSRTVRWRGQPDWKPRPEDAESPDPKSDPGLFSPKPTFVFQPKP